MPQWTKDQETAIHNRGGALLVSAAAGSGKTAVLVERVLTRLTDPDDPVDIDRLLLVTFTNAASSVTLSVTPLDARAAMPITLAAPPPRTTEDAS